MRFLTAVILTALAILFLLTTLALVASGPLRQIPREKRRAKIRASWRDWTTWLRSSPARWLRWS